MKKYSVTLPITGTLFIPDVNAESEKEAIGKALNISYDPLQHDVYWSQTHRITQGNVFCGELNDAYAEEE